MKRVPLILLLLVVLLLSACIETSESPAAEVAQQPEETANEATEVPTAEPTATATVTTEPSATMTATLTATATLVPTVTQTATITPIPFTGFEAAKYKGAAYGPGNLTYLLFEVPGVTENYTLKVEDRTLSCAPHAEYADILVCETEGYDPTYGQLLCEFYTAESETLIHSATYYHASPDTGPTYQPWYIAWDAGNQCPQRGQNVSCETEWRFVGGTPCMISSCFDACGHYYSIDNCSQLTGLVEFTSQHPGWQWDPLTALYFAP